MDKEEKKVCGNCVWYNKRTKGTGACFQYRKNSKSDKESLQSL